MLRALFSLLCLKVIWSEKYIVVISPKHYTQNFMNDHIILVRENFPNCSINQLYTNFWKLKFLSYSLSCSDNFITKIRELVGIKFIELVPQAYKISNLQNVAPLNQIFLRAEENAVTQNGYCTMTYDTYHKLLAENFSISKFHNLVGFMDLCNLAFLFIS
jgi:hypothetical protein